MTTQPHAHPLQCLRHQLGLTLEGYLARLDQAHRALGLGAMACNRQKAWRWEHGRATPDQSAQLAIAHLHGIPPSEVDDAPWPEWLLPAIPHEDSAVASWDQMGTLTVLGRLAGGSGMDRRKFLIVTSAGLGASVLDWQNALVQAVAPAPTGRRRITGAMVGAIEARLDQLRHLDDALGSGELRDLAAAEFAFVVAVLKEATYDEATGRRLYSAAAEAARCAAWVNFDAGHHALAQRYFTASLRSSATAGDALIGAYSLSFQAIQSYTAGDPRDAVHMIEAARTQTASRATPRFRAMLAARAARSMSKCGDRLGCSRALAEARDAWAAGPRDEDPAYLYWVTPGEIEMIAGSSALELGDPKQAIRRFEAAAAAEYDGDDRYPRSHAIYQGRAAEAYLQLGELDAAVHAGRHAVRCLGGVDSARSSATLDGLRGRLIAHRRVPVVADFLEMTA